MKGSTVDYWKEAISEAFDDAKISATDEQVGIVAGWAEGAHENYGQAHGYDVIGSPIETDKDREIERLKKQVQELEGDIEIFRQSVARRRGVPAQNVYVERYGPGKGDVMYSER